MAEAVLQVKSELGKIVEQLEKIKATASGVADELKLAGKDVGEELNKETKKTETFFGKLQSVARRTADQLRKDFKSLAAINSLSGALKLSQQFSGSIKETITLSDAIRKLGASFGIAQKDFGKLQTNLTKGMGEIGMSSEEAGETLKGLAGTGVMGEANLTAYSQRAAQLASLGGEKGQGGSISSMLAGVVREKGGNVNDPKQMEAVAKAVAKAMEGTGKGASELLSQMQQTFQSMTAEQRKKTSVQGLTNLATAETVAGPEAAEAIKKYLSMNKQERAGLDAQGFAKIFNKEGGIDIKGLKQFAKDIKSRGMDLRGGAQTFGFSPEEAEGLVRLTESADTLGDALERTAKASDDINTKTRKNMGLNEAFQANVNKVKAMVAGPLSAATQGLTDVLSGASETKGGAGAVVAGGGILAALLAGGALKGIGGGLGIGGMAKNMTLGAAKREAYEEISGRKVQDVYVTNADEIGASGGVGAAATGIGGKIAGAAGVLGAGAVGYEVGNAINEIPGVSDAIQAGFDKVVKALGGTGVLSNEEAFKKAQQVHTKITVETHNPNLKVTKQPQRGASVAPTR